MKEPTMSFEMKFNDVLPMRDEENKEALAELQEAIKSGKAYVLLTEVEENFMSKHMVGDVTTWVSMVIALIKHLEDRATFYAKDGEAYTFMQSLTGFMKAEQEKKKELKGNECNS